jgi:hypothetical protein
MDEFGMTNVKMYPLEMRSLEFKHGFGIVHGSTFFN